MEMTAPSRLCRWLQLAAPECDTKVTHRSCG